MIKYIGKALLIEDSKRVIVIGDLHFGYEESLRKSGINVPFDINFEIGRDLSNIFNKVGKVDKIIIVGDLKHGFDSISNEEWNEIVKVIDYLKENCEEIIIIKGNHDVILESITKKRDIFVKETYIWGEFAFVHGDKDFIEIYDKNIKYWIMGHAHPAIILSDGTKQEKYKCFLEGNYKKRKIIVLPSFIGVNEGTDVRSYDLGLAWKFDLDKFNVRVVNGLEVLDFGKLSKIK